MMGVGGQDYVVSEGRLEKSVEDRKQREDPGEGKTSND